MDFKAFDRSKLDEYARQAKELYGNLPEYKEMEEKQKNRTEEEERLLADRFMLLFKEAGKMKDTDPASPESQNLVKRIQDYITENMYCYRFIRITTEDPASVTQSLEFWQERTGSRERCLETANGPEMWILSRLL